MLLRELLQDTGVTVPQTHAGQVIEYISCDSREAMPNGLFVALGGHKVNGADFIKDAIAQGAKVIVKHSAGMLGAYTIPDGICVLDVADPKAFLRQIAPKFYGNPADKVKVIGVTGTNGKTTVSYLLESIIHAAGKKCGVTGTINYRIGDEVLPSKNTTPGYLDAQRFLARLVEEGVGYCVMEASSHALDQGRLDGIHFVSGVFSNLTQDHLDYHKDMADYFRAKSLLFSGLSPEASAVINIDNSYGPKLVALTKAKVSTYAIDAITADIRAMHISYSSKGTQFELQFPGGKVPIRTRMIGRHNVYNILAAFASAYTQGFSVITIVKGIEALNHVPGRLEPVDAGQDFYVFIDYAHTDDGLMNVLQSLKAVTAKHVLVVFGCGGDRDAVKRPLMGHVACLLADHTVITSDNPRSEDPRAIIDQIVKGFTRTNFEVCVDRTEAIGRILKRAKPGDVVLIAGKGHEQYQVFKDKTIPFNERAITLEFLKANVHH